ncbi:MAG: hypothetical protein DSM107014_15510 [Gomphosphaeria aponina SAG 52.96 = DSM 107014]|uniref:Sulfotransferase domain-containing protein n=1 Tax=Gomphosphaeria aponina SAG 52.96 = DSM 107014 TaxID=1521640 RepID=A0A941GSZ5_9CHRO|nr:hypothetical protein [Gomphosphaeria aponina SAG 52.96 = DSM 107014]
MKILICGTGKSGTTAIAYAVQAVFKGHSIIFEPKTLTSLNYQEENFIVKSLNIIQNKLWQDEQSYILRFEKKIMIIRHPFDTIISFLLYDPFNRSQFDIDKNVKIYIDAIKQETHKENNRNISQVIKCYKKVVGLDVTKVILPWYKGITKVIENQSLDFFVFKYEDFVEGRLEGINGYLGVDNFTNQIKVDSKYSRVARSKKHSDWKNWFSQQDIKEIKPYFSDFLEKFNYETNWGDSLGAIDPNTSYLYTINVINEKRKRKGLKIYQDLKTFS